MLLKNENDLVAALYSRVSTTEQAIDGYSIGEQERILVNYCESKGYKIYKSYVDPGYSGKDIIHRPAMTELLNDAKEKKFNLVISWKINRISRKLGDAIKIIEILEKNGIQYHSYSEPFENRTPAGKMQFQMMALVGEFERNTIAENVKMGMYAKARNGEWCGGVSPLGYDWELMEGRQGSSRRKSKLVINEKEAQIIRYFYNEYAQGKGYKTIVNKANKMGYRTKLGNTFSVAQLRTILMNPVYMGKVRFNVRRDWNEKRRRFINPDPIICDGIHEAIIDEELFGKVQYLIAQKNGKPSRIYDGEYPLTGILKCPQCGSGMVISSTTNTLKDGTKKRIVYYACGSWKNKGTAVCRCNSIRVDKANNKVFECLKDILKNENIVKDVVDKLNEKNDKKVEKAKNDLKHFENDIINIQLRKDKIFEAYEQGIINSDEFLERKKKLDIEIDNLKRGKEEALVIFAENKKEQIPTEFVMNILNDFSKLLYAKNVSRELKKRLLHMIISEITIGETRDVNKIKIYLSNQIVQYIKERNGGTLSDSVPPFLSYNKYLRRDGVFLDFKVS